MSGVLHPYVPPPDPAWGDFCWQSNPDEGGERCGWPQKDHESSDTHDYVTKQVPALDLDHTMVLVGESGGLSAIYDVRPNSLIDGFVTVETEHGPLVLDDDREQTFSVLDPERN